MIVLDLMPWSTVNKPGFLRNQKLSTPNFELGSEKYYRDLLDPSYCKIKTALKSKLEVDNPIRVLSRSAGRSSRRTVSKKF